MDKAQRRIGELEDALKERDRRLEELKDERDRQAELIARMREQLEECDAQIDRWIEAFNMVQDDKGVWRWGDDLIEDRDKWFDWYTELRAEWNRFVPRYNATVSPRNMGRPLAASDAQRDRILSYRKAGKSLRWIAEEMNLGLQTVRTVIDKKDGVDRATLGRLQRIAPDKFAEAKTKRSRRDIVALPKRIKSNKEGIASLVKEAKGVGGDRVHSSRRRAAGSHKTDQ
jgi:hypothetical protein